MFHVPMGGYSGWWIFLILEIQGYVEGVLVLREENRFLLLMNIGASRTFMSMMVSYYSVSNWRVILLLF